MGATHGGESERGTARAGTVTFVRMDELEPRVRAICDLNVAEAREYGGRHEYDGVPQDLSHDGVAAGLSRLAAARQFVPARSTTRTTRRTCARSRSCSGWSTPTLSCTGATRCYHLGELDLACYDKDYAPAAERHAARAAHLAAWPAVIDAAVACSTRFPRPSRPRCSAPSGGWRPASRRTRTRGGAGRGPCRARRLVTHVQRAALERAA